MVTHIVIPVRDQIQYTKSIVSQLQLELGWDKCWIFDNGSVDNTWDFLTELANKDPRFLPQQAIGKSIYNMWNDGFILAKKDKANHVAIINNDIIISKNTFQILNNALAYNKKAWIAYPDYNDNKPGPINYAETSGTYRHGGMSGFCFMLKAEKIDWSPLVDPIFQWWGGDDDIAFEVEKRGGKQIRVLGLPIEHILEGTARHHNLGAQKEADLKAIINKWGR